MSRRRPITALALGDIKDLNGFVHAAVRRLPGPPSDHEETEELVSQGIFLAVQRNAGLATGQSLQHALSGWLDWRLQDYRRGLHPEIRRNSRAGTTYVLESPTTLTGQHEAHAIGL